MKPQLTAIVAMTPDRVIGKGGTLPWHLPEDLAFFKRVNWGQVSHFNKYNSLTHINMLD